MAIAGPHLNATRSFKQSRHPHTLLIQLLHRQSESLLMRQQVIRCVQSHLVDRPGHQLQTQLTDQSLVGDEIAQPQARHGVAFGEGIQKDDIGAFSRLTGSDDRQEGEVGITLVDDKQSVTMIVNHLQQFVGIPYTASGVVWIAQPDHLRPLGYLIQGIDIHQCVFMELAGITIL